MATPYRAHTGWAAGAPPCRCQPFLLLAPRGGHTLQGRALDIMQKKDIKERVEGIDLLQLKGEICRTLLDAVAPLPLRASGWRQQPATLRLSMRLRASRLGRSARSSSGRLVRGNTGACPASWQRFIQAAQTGRKYRVGASHQRDAGGASRLRLAHSSPAIASAAQCPAPTPRAPTPSLDGGCAQGLFRRPRTPVRPSPPE